MRKIYVNVMLLVSLILMIMGNGAKWNWSELAHFEEWQGRAFATGLQSEQMTLKEFERVLTLQERQPIYMMVPSPVQIGELEADQPVAITGEDEVYYEIRVGKMPAFIPKGRGMLEKKRLLPAVDMQRFAAVKTRQKTKVYEEADLQGAVFSELESDYRFPVVGEQDDWYIIKIGERPGYIHKQSAELDKGLPVLLYHQILPRNEMKTEISTVSLELFTEQMEYLAEGEFTTLTSKELYNYLEGRLVVPSKSLLITFDDGLLSSKDYAYPILKQYGFTAPHHIISSRMDRTQKGPVFDGGGLLHYLTVEDLDELKDVFQFEAHTDELHELSTKNPSSGVVFEHTEEEIADDLRRNLEHVPSAVSLAYPYGQYNKQFIAAAKENGLLIGFTTVEGYANMDQSNYEVSRFGITEKRSFEQFTTYVDGKMTWP